MCSDYCSGRYEITRNVVTEKWVGKTYENNFLQSLTKSTQRWSFEIEIGSHVARNLQRVSSGAKPDLHIAER